VICVWRILFVNSVGVDGVLGGYCECVRFRTDGGMIELEKTGRIAGKGVLGG
jgi:hypothetical protein